MCTIKWTTILLLLGGVVLVSWISYPAPVVGYKMKLSDYGFFQGDIAEMIPAEDVIPYELNTPLFSDYALKARFIRFPEGKTVSYDDSLVLDFPVGTAIVKTFYYPVDARNPEKGRQLMETRVLLNEKAGWKALPYVWNAEQTDAMLDVAGARKEVSWKDDKGKKQKLSYVVPNMNQCKGCHLRGEILTPIGPSARQLNGAYTYPSGERLNQLSYWEAKGVLTELPALTSVPSVPIWKDPLSGSREERARGYLDINCAHCHNPDGPANTSGLYLDIHTEEPAKLGIRKSPIAAGRGSGGRKYDIDPGNPNASILVYRMESEDPGVMMPELSRKLLHHEGIELIRNWIAGMSKE
ncbi:MAG: SO2930 family diheme c-type cytochrome [Bacteroidota bacterium]